MAKKYLLYIHSPSFNNEANKSALVNELLDTHYGRKQQPATGSINVQRPTAISKNDKDYSLCEHGQVRGFCKHGCH